MTHVQALIIDGPYMGEIVTVPASGRIFAFPWLEYKDRLDFNWVEGPSA